MLVLRALVLLRSLLLIVVVAASPYDPSRCFPHPSVASASFTELMSEKREDGDKEKTSAVPPNGEGRECD